MAEWLDNDQDGCVDNPAVLTGLTTIDSGKLKAAGVVPGADGSWNSDLGLKLEAAGTIIIGFFISFAL